MVGLPVFEGYSDEALAFFQEHLVGPRLALESFGGATDYYDHCAALNRFLRWSVPLGRFGR